MSAEVEERIEGVSTNGGRLGSNVIAKTSEGDTEISQNPKENTRKIIASLYVWAFFIIIFIILLIGVLNNFSAGEFKDMLVAVSGVLSGPLGFIVGYYFKASNE